MTRVRMISKVEMLISFAKFAFNWMTSGRSTGRSFSPLVFIINRLMVGSLLVFRPYLRNKKCVTSANCNREQFYTYVM